MLQVFQYIKGKVIFKDRDYIFSNVETFLKIKPYLITKLSGVWNIVFLQLDLEEALELESLLSQSDTIHSEMYLKPDILAKFIANKPTYKANSKSTWEVFNDLIATFPKTMEDKVASELYKRSNRNIETIKDNLDILKDSELSHITLKDLNRLVPADNTIYPREIILTAIFKNNTILKNSHPRAKSYSFKQSLDLAKKLEDTSSRSYIYFSIRKFLRILLEEKLKYLNQEPIKHADLIEVIDYSEIVFMYTLFENNNSDLLYCNLIAIEARCMDKDMYTEVYLKQGGH